MKQKYRITTLVLLINIISSCNEQNSFKCVIEDPEIGEYYIFDLGQSHANCDLCSSSEIFFPTGQKVIFCENVNKCIISDKIYGKRGSKLYPIYYYQFQSDSINSIDSLYVFGGQQGVHSHNGNDLNFYCFYLDHIDNVNPRGDSIRNKLFIDYLLTDKLDSLAKVNFR